MPGFPCQFGRDQNVLIWGRVGWGVRIGRTVMQGWSVIRCKITLSSHLAVLLGIYPADRPTGVFVIADGNLKSRSARMGVAAFLTGWPHSRGPGWENACGGWPALPPKTGLGHRSPLRAPIP